MAPCLQTVGASNAPHRYVKLGGSRLVAIPPVATETKVGAVSTFVYSMSTVCLLTDRVISP